MTSLGVLTSDPDGPVVRHRVEALRPAYAAAGVGEIEVAAIPKRLTARALLFRRFARHDGVLLVRKLFTAAELGLLQFAVRRLIYEFDDAVMFRGPFRGRPRSLARAWRFRRTARAADLVLAGNDVLAYHAREAGAENVTLAPTAVDTARFVPTAGGGPERGGVRIGWIGSRSTRLYLRAIDDALCEVLAARPGTVFCVMADRPPRMRAPLTFTPWSLDGEVPFLQSLDIGTMPLIDDCWSRGKCAFKMLQYMACGVATVADAVGANVEVAGGGRCARLIGPGGSAGPDGWAAALLRLIDDEQARRDLAAAGRAHVEQRYSTRVVGPQVAQAVARALGAADEPTG